MGVRLDDIDYFLAVAAHGKIRAAAAALNVSQPAITQGLQRLEKEIVDGRRFAGDAVVVHGVNAVGGDVHLEEVAVGFAEVMNTFDGDAAKGEVVGELPVGDGERWEVVTEPVRKNLHESTFLV